MKQNLTVSLEEAIIRKAKVLAAKRGTSISGLVADHIELLVSDDESYQQAKRDAIALLEHGFPMGGSHRVPRDELHER